MRIRDERLPWLPDEPAPAAAAPSSPAPVKAGTAKAMWPWYLLLLLLVVGVAVGAWWLGTRQREAPPPELPAEVPLPIPMTEGPPGNVTAAQVASPAAEDPMPALTGAPTAAPAPASRVAGRSRSEPAPARTGSAEAEAPQRTGRSVFPADEPAILPAPAASQEQAGISPQARRYSGRVVQLGAFPTRAQAEQTWRRVTRRYPYLATKPKMVNTVEVRPLGGGRGTRMYRLQLGTSSQAQSAVICQQLERAGQSCVVVY